MQKEWYLSSEQEVLRETGSARTGLSGSEAKLRLQKFGRNAISREKKTSPFVILLGQFKSPLVWVLLAAMLLSVLLKELIDFYVILAVVVANGLFGFWQEYKAEESIEALKKLVSLKAMVIRDGKRVQIPAEEVVVGDVLVIETGDKIAADARILESTNLRCEESALTGESLSSRKDAARLSGRLAIGDQRNMVFAGTSVAGGHATAVVTATAMQTQVGNIARLLRETPDQPTPIQMDLKRLALQLTLLVILVAVVMIGVDLLAGKELVGVVKKGIALAVAAIPEGLPAVVTIAFALGVQAMARKNALMRKLPSVETLGACTVICTDKTGTLTYNQMTVKKLYIDGKVVSVSGEGYATRGEFSEMDEGVRELLRIGALNNNARIQDEHGQVSVVGDPTEAALLVSARKAGLIENDVLMNFPRVGEIEFSSERKRMTTIHREHKTKKTLAFTKGAPEVVLGLCSHVLENGRVQRLTADKRKAILDANTQFTDSALRVLGFARRELEGEKVAEDDVERKMVFVGLQAMIDPPRKEVRDAIATCQSAGIKVIMITGDHLGTARAIARQIGLQGKAIEGTSIEQIDLDREVENIAVFARVDPKHKIKVIAALKKRGHVVAMTGDGANDAPALKRADLGIAMGIAGTDVAREASDMVLADDNFSTIVAAVQQGRIIYDNIRKFVVYLLSSNIGEVLTLLVATVLGLIDPLTARQILWINLVTDLFPATSLAVDPGEPDVMQRPPRDVNEKILSKRRMAWMGILGVVMMTGTLFVFEAFNPDLNLVKAQTMAFTTLVFFQLFNVFNQRSESKSAFAVGLFSNKWLLVALGVSVLLQVLAVQSGFFNIVFETTPLSLAEWGIAVATGASILVFGEVIKLFRKV